jgi:GNAT superfamily N-acetyltransferase
MPVIIRDIAAADEAQWRELWVAYIAFQRGSVPDAVTAHTWARLMDPARPLIGRVAEVEGRVCGFSVSLLHEGTWALTPYCYLEDLFVAECLRGQGIGRALLEDLMAMGRQRGWSRLYWHTMADNLAARRFYDAFTPSDGDVRYRIAL